MCAQLAPILQPTLDVSRDRNILLLRNLGYNKALIALAKELGGRWSTQHEAWKFPLYICNGIAVEETFEHYRLVKSLEYREWKDASSVSPDDVIIPASVKATYDKLYPFQKEAVDWLVENPYGHPGTLLALSPGLGKTVVALTAAGALQLDRVLIIAPLSLLNVWRWEHEKWFGRSSGSSLPPLTVSYGKKPPTEGWVVTNYNTVTSPSRASEYWEEDWDLIIMDESVLIKNRKTQRFANIKNLRESTDRIWLLSGSPITRHPNDLWAQFHIIEPRAFPSYWRFTKRWCVVEKTIWGTAIKGSAARNMHKDFADLLFVKHQEEVLPDLPEMVFQNLSARMTGVQEKIYAQMESQFVAQLEEEVSMDAPTKLAQLIRLQQISSNLCNLNASSLLRDAADWPDASGKHTLIEELLEAEAIDLPLLIWTHWSPGARTLEDRLMVKYNVGLIQGGMDNDERDDLFSRFKGSKDKVADADVDILILALGVGKFGHTLNQTKTVIYLDKTWNADDYIQSLHRVKRIGLTHSPRVISIGCPGTVDDLVEENLAGKMEPIAHITNADLVKLLRSLNRHIA